MSGMEELFRMMASQAGAESAPKRPALIVEALRDAAAPYLAGAHTFKEGDLVTPRQSSTYKDKGEPHIVVAVNPTAVHDFASSNPGATSYGRKPDLRVLCWHESGDYPPFWVEAAQFEPWVEKAEETPTPSETAEAA